MSGAFMRRFAFLQTKIGASVLVFCLLGEEMF